jgi:glycosyltransferase involved in cell wall biosynthesis
MTLYLVQPLLWVLRSWDRAGAKRVTEFVAISSFIAARIRRFYGRRAVVIAPPVRMEGDVNTHLTSDESAVFEAQQEPFFLCAGALVPYKRVDVAVEASSRLGVQLWVVGDGPEQSKLEAKASERVRFFGRVSEGFLWEAYRRCRALLFPGVEDFGITPVECLATGRPVIAIQAGGVTDTVDGILVNSPVNNLRSSPSGVMLPKSAVGSSLEMAKAIEFFCKIEQVFDSEKIRAAAQQFDYAAFFANWRRFAQKAKIFPGLTRGEGAKAQATREVIASVDTAQREAI